MNVSDIPAKLVIPFANNAGASFIRSIPAASQIGITPGRASLYDGFPPLTAQPIGSGGIPPSIKDFNGILFDVSAWARWVSAGGPVYFDGVAATAWGGYPEGAIVQSSVTAGLLWLCTADGNVVDPDGAGTGWQALLPVPATVPELIAGVNTVKYVTPATLAGIRAVGADVRAGTSQALYMTPSAFYDARGSDVEIIAGTDDHAYVTPAGLAAIANSTAGVIYHPGGLIEQFGTYVAGLTTNNYTIPFNIPFLSTIDMVQISLILNTATNDAGNTRTVYWRRSSTTLANLAFKALIESGTADGVSWHAFGR